MIGKKSKTSDRQPTAPAEQAPSTRRPAPHVRHDQDRRRVEAIFSKMGAEVLDRQSFVKMMELLHVPMHEGNALLEEYPEGSHIRVQEFLDLVFASPKVSAETIEAGAKTHNAFVFVKPHAVCEKVKALVKEKLKVEGLMVKSEGPISWQIIDEKKLIDTHYGAIAAKAVTMKPKELTVQEKSQEGFEKMFGVKWSNVLEEGLVFNALDGAKKLGITTDEVGRKWETLKKGEGIIKFGGGFYCGKVDGIYVINGFYMSMRSKFTAPGSSIYYYEVEWPAEKMSWADFRGKLLGSTDPATAPAGALRQMIYSKWSDLGLPSQPDTGDNGVHGSASPFEALAERCNWLQASIETDAFGKALMASGIPLALTNEWFNDPQVHFEGGKKSLFDLLEDLDAAACLKKCKEIAVSDSMNTAETIEAGGKWHSAFVFVKPHAVCEKVKAMVKQKLAADGLMVKSEGPISWQIIDEKKLIDTHYGAIAAKAVTMKPKELTVQEKSQEGFEKMFGVKWSNVLEEGLVFNALDGAKKLGITTDEVGRKWETLKKGEGIIKFGGGFYCGKVDGIYVINGFYMSMRSKFTAPGSSIYYYEVEWPAEKMSWADFRGKLLGSTDPATAPAGSLRQMIYSKWSDLGLPSQPDTGDNGVHGSASPFEALAERRNWLQASIETDAFGKALMASGIPLALTNEWFNDPQVHFEGGKKSLFDLLEDLDAAACLKKCKEIAGTCT